MAAGGQVNRVCPGLDLLPSHSKRSPGLDLLPSHSKRSLGLGLLPSQSKIYGTAARRNRDSPYSSPETEEKSSGIWHFVAKNKSTLYYNLYWVQGDSDITWNYIGTVTLRLPLLLYESSRDRIPNRSLG